MWRGMTWRRIVFTQAIVALAVLVESFEGDLLGTWMGHPSLQYVAMSLSAFFLLATTLYSDELVNRGARSRLVYPITVLLAFPVAFVVTGVTEEIYYAILRLPQAVAEAHRWVFISTAEHIAVICAFGMVIYMNRRTAERMLERVQAAELKRVQLERQLIDSRLAMAEAQVDPQMLFSALAEIRDGFSRSLPNADAKLDELVQHLRSSLARAVAIDGEDSASP
jgi:sensor histidine kinase YesM